MNGIIWKDGTITYETENEVKTKKIKEMNFYIYNKDLKAYYTGYFFGMPGWSPLKAKAEIFNCPIEAGDWAWKHKTSGDLVVTD